MEQCATGEPVEETAFPPTDMDVCWAQGQACTMETFPVLLVAGTRTGLQPSHHSSQDLGPFLILGATCQVQVSCSWQLCLGFAGLPDKEAGGRAQLRSCLPGVSVTSCTF